MILIPIQKCINNLLVKSLHPTLQCTIYNIFLLDVYQHTLLNSIYELFFECHISLLSVYRYSYFLLLYIPILLWCAWTPPYLAEGSWAGSMHLLVWGQLVLSGRGGGFECQLVFVSSTTGTSGQCSPSIILFL
jgi:hypothetical protein